MFTITAEEVSQLSVKAGIAFSLACVFVLAYGYNRIHMTNHFLSDVCFGTLITYLIYSLISTAFLRGHKE